MNRKKWNPAVAVLGVALASAAAQQPAALENTPAQQRIAAAQHQIAADPKKPQAFNDLALADIRRARETADTRYLEEAEQALAHGLALEPASFQLQKTQVALLLAWHRYAPAMEQAATLNRRTPDDPALYGYLAEADLATGKYPEAERAAQWMLNLLPNNIPGLLLGAQLRVLYGDSTGALELLNLAYTETSPTELEEQAWIANQIATVQLDAGNPVAAAAILARAGQLFPNYPRTLENLARLRLAQNQPPAAVALLLEARQLDTDPAVLYQLALAQDAAGKPAEAQAAYAAFEKLAAPPATPPPDAARDLVLFYASKTATVATALKLAQQQAAASQDVATLDAYAWALYANGNYAAADTAIKKALAAGIQSAPYFDHAGHIAQQLHHDDEAAKDFELAVRTNPSSTEADDARQAAKLPPIQPAPVTPVLPQPTEIAAPATPLPGTPTTPTFPQIPTALLTPRPTDTDRVIQTAQARVAHNPAGTHNTTDAQAYATLGAAFFQRARETGDVSDYQSAEQSLTKSLDLVSADFAADAALGTMAEVCMGEHRFTDALAFAQKALALGSGDVSPFAIVGDAYADMGDYDKAAQAYARLTPRDMTLAPRAAYARDSRLAYLKFIAGNTAQAIQLMKAAVDEGTQAQLPAENLAWLYYELGEYSTQAGDIAAADQAYIAALTIHPGDYRALASLARLRANHGRYAEAIVLYQKAIAVIPMPLFVAELGDLYEKSGNPAGAGKQYHLVAYIGLLGHINQVLHNRDLALFYADHDRNLPEALQLARKELEVRHDVYTWDALAWALYKNGSYTEAGDASAKALRYGTRDPLLLFHAGLIAEKLNHPEEARNNLSAALQINPDFHLIYAHTARQQLGLLNTQAAARDTQATAHEKLEHHAE